MAAKKAAPHTGMVVPTLEPPPETLLKSSLRLLSVRARSVRELRGRLLRKGFNSSDVSYCLRWLMDRDLLNDDSFARSFTRDRLRFSPRSPSFLKRELADKGVSSSLAGEVVDAVLQEEGISAGDLSDRTARSWVRKQSPSVRVDLFGDRFSPERERARRRLYGFLARRGFVGEGARQGLEAGEREARKLEEEARKLWD